MFKIRNKDLEKEEYEVWLDIGSNGRLELHCFTGGHETIIFKIEKRNAIWYMECNNSIVISDDGRGNQEVLRLPFNYPEKEK